MNRAILSLIVFTGLFLQSCTVINPMYVENSLVLYQEVAIKPGSETNDGYKAYYLEIYGILDSCKYSFKNSGCEGLSKGDEVLIEIIMLINEKEGRVYLMSSPGKPTPEIKFVNRDGVDLAGLLEQGDPGYIIPRGTTQSDEEFIDKIFDEITVHE